MLLCISTFSTSIFNYTSLSILNVLLMSLCLSSPFTVLFRTPVYAPLLSNPTMAVSLLSHILGTESSLYPSLTSLLLYFFVHIEYTLLQLLLFLLPNFLSTSMLQDISYTKYSSVVLQRQKPCLWFSCILVPLYLHPLYSTNITTSYLVFYPCFSRAILLGGIPLSPQYSCAFLYKKHAGLFSCYTFCRLTACATSSLLLLFFSTSIFGHSHLQYPTPQYLKHCTPFSTVSCFLTFTSSLTSHCITLLAIASNLFWEIGFPFAPFFLFLQLQARYLSFLHSQYVVPSISALSLVRTHC